MPKRGKSAGNNQKANRLLVAALIVALVLLLVLIAVLALRLLQKPSAAEVSPAPVETAGAASPAQTEEPRPDEPTGAGDAAAPQDSAADEASGGNILTPEEPSLLDYQGYWEDVAEPLNTAQLSLDQSGHIWLTVAFYRLVGVDAVYTGECDGDGWLLFRGEYDEIVCHLLPRDDSFTLYLEVPEEYSYSPSFGRSNEYVFRRREASDTAWLGAWISEDGETLEIEEQRENCILLRYTGYTASGESTFISYYTLYFEDAGRLIAAEDKSVEQAAGWCYRLQLDGDTIIMHSRYPDKLFQRWVLTPAP